MDDFLGKAVPSAMADEDTSESKARTAAIGLACLNEIESAAARRRRPVVKRYGPPATLTACLFGLAWLGWSHTQGRAPTPPSAETNLTAKKTAEESHPQRVEVEALRAAQSMNREEVSAPQTAKPGFEATKNGAGPRIVEAAAITSRLPPKPVEKIAKGGERTDRIGLKIAALLAADSVADHSVSATPARRREQRARHDAFDPSQHPNAPGAPRTLGTIRLTAPTNKSSADYAYGQSTN
jgi:hypothetical protein